MDITIFNYQEKEVRTAIDENGEFLWVGKDVCEILGYADHINAIKKHLKEKHKRGCQIATPLGGNQTLTCITESGLYRLILRCQLKEAEKFQDWVEEEVLPSIRKTGSYQIQPIDPMAYLNDPAAMRGILLSYTEKVLALEEEKKVLTPKAEALDLISNADGMTCITDAAKTLQMRPKDLFAMLSAKRWIYRRIGGKNWIGYQDKIQQGLLNHKITTVTDVHTGKERIIENVLVTTKGIAKLSELIKKAA